MLIFIKHLREDAQKIKVFLRSHTTKTQLKKIYPYACKIFIKHLREAAKRKSSSTSGRATKRGGGGGEGRGFQGKKNFLKIFFFFLCMPPLFPPPPPLNGLAISGPTFFLRLPLFCLIYVNNKLINYKKKKHHYEHYTFYRKK